MIYLKIMTFFKLIKQIFFIPKQKYNEKILKDCFAKAADTIIKKQQEPDYDEKFKKIEEEIAIQSSIYLSRLEKAQSQVIAENRHKRYKG